MGRLLVLVVAGLVAIIACSSGTATACKLDTDCPQSFVCRQDVCTPNGSDGGAPSIPDAAPACGNENATCSFPTDCCSGNCTNGVCSTSVVPTQPSCVGLSGLCQDDCCTGYTCVKGVCQ